MTRAKLHLSSIWLNIQIWTRMIQEWIRHKEIQWLHLGKMVIWLDKIWVNNAQKSKLNNLDQILWRTKKNSKSSN